MSIEQMNLTEKDKITKVIITVEEGTITDKLWLDKKEEIANLLDLEYKNVVLVPSSKVSIIVNSEV